MPPFSQLNSFCLMRGDAIPGLMLKCYCNIVLLHFTSSFLNYNKNQSSLCQIRSYSLLNNNQFIYHTALLTCFIEHDSDCRSESVRSSCNQWNKKCTQPYTMYYSNNDWYVCASCTKASRFQSTSAASKLQA